MFDIVLFESTGTINHYRDIEMIAKLIQQQGFSVAIANVYLEKDLCKDPSITHINFKKKFEYRFSFTNHSNKFFRFIRNRFIAFKLYHYLCYVAKELNTICKNVYIGSCANGNSFSWVKCFKTDMQIFIWGLRSYRLYEYKLHPFSIDGFNSFFNKKYYFGYPNIRFFISDEMIRDEFLHLGISSERLILRPERTTENYNLLKKDKNRKNIKLLSIGTIRPDKRIEFILKAIKQLNDDEISYIIAGRSFERDNYEKVLEKCMCGCKNVNRFNRRLSDQEFDNLIYDTDFLILCDKKQISNITNGTMNESLLKGRPIIAPNYNPYKYYLEKFNIGLLYDPNSLQSLVDTILKAKELGINYFYNGLHLYQETLLTKNVATVFVKELKL